MCENPLKRDTSQFIESYRKSGFNIIMITGDNILTAISVGLQLKLGVTQSALTLNYDETDQKFYWLSSKNDPKHHKKHSSASTVHEPQPHISHHQEPATLESSELQSLS